MSRGSGGSVTTSRRASRVKSNTYQAAKKSSRRPKSGSKSKPVAKMTKKKKKY